LHSRKKDNSNDTRNDEDEECNHLTLSSSQNDLNPFGFTCRAFPRMPSMYSLIIWIVLVVMMTLLYQVTEIKMITTLQIDGKKNLTGSSVGEYDTVASTEAIHNEKEFTESTVGKDSIVVKLETRSNEEENKNFSESTVGNVSIVVAPERRSNDQKEYYDSEDEMKMSNKHHNLMPDFAIVGFGKCGTTSLMNFLNIPNKIYMGFPYSEGLVQGHKCPAGLSDLRQIYQDYSDKPIKKGFKCPYPLYISDSLNVIEFYQEFSPHPKLIVSVRHPVTHFQSSYNYFYQNRTADNLPNPNSLSAICNGFCGKPSNGPLLIKRNRFDDPYDRKCLQDYNEKGIELHDRVCTGRSSSFHYFLSRLRLTPMSDDREWQLLDHHSLKILKYFNGTLFLLESEQLHDISGLNATRGMAIRSELEKYIDLEPGALLQRAFPPKDTLEMLKNICHDEYEGLRGELVERGGRAGKWIIEYLLKSDRVVVPNREHFIELVENWRVDPCIKEE
jgi:hypothetical protein